MEKKNIGMKVAIVILSLLVVGLGGFVVYDKELNNNDNDVGKDTNITDENNNDNDNNEDEISGLEKLLNSWWWIENTDKFLYFANSDFIIFREGKGCGPQEGCGNGEINLIKKDKKNQYDIQFTWGDDYESIDYLATIDISNIDNNEIILTGFYTINGNDKMSLIDAAEKYIYLGTSWDEAMKNWQARLNF